ncbi:MAG TPA: hypothetical protein VJB97_02260 [Candidatus Paceibacterota bacterium]
MQINVRVCSRAIARNRRSLKYVLACDSAPEIGQTILLPGPIRAEVACSVAARDATLQVFVEDPDYLRLAESLPAYSFA